MFQLDIDALHAKVLYPVVRVRTGKAGGSGVLVYSELGKDGKYVNIVLTCEHVISEAISLRDDWDTVLKRNIKKEFFEPVSVEIFDYEGSNVISSNSTQADVIAYDKHHDLAALKLYNPRQIQYVAGIFPKDGIRGLRVGNPCIVCGCSLLHDPFPNPGTLTYLREIIDQKAYLMANAPAIFGNSGGGMFNGITGELMGLVSRVTGIQLGFGFDVMTWMEFSTHPERMYEFFKKQELQFIYDKNDSYEAAMIRREKRQKDSLKEMFWKTDDEKQPRLNNDLMQTP